VAESAGKRGKLPSYRNNSAQAGNYALRLLFCKKNLKRTQVGHGAPAIPMGIEHLMALESGRKLEVAEAPDAALYIGSIADELSRLAKSHDLESLAYILDTARLEADEICKLWGGQADRASGGPG